MDLIDLIGFAGAILVLAAFALSNTRSVRVTPRALAVMNLGAGAALALNGLVHHAWPSTVVNTVWFVIAVVALGRAAVPGVKRNRPRTEAGDSAAFDSGSAQKVKEPWVVPGRGPWPSSSTIVAAETTPRIVRGGQDRAPGGHFLAQHPDDPIDR